MAVTINVTNDTNKNFCQPAVIIFYIKTGTGKDKIATMTTGAKVSLR